MKRSLRRSQEQNDAPIPETINHRLHLYSLAASAAGVGLLALAQPAGAQVVYTPAHITITDGDLFLDLNCGTRVNFWLADNLEATTFGIFRELMANGTQNASVIADKNGAVALASGSVIGSSRTFKNVHRNELLLAEAYSFSYYFRYRGVTGNWVNANQAFLGLKFNIQGQVHYGWAQMTVRASVNSFAADATLIGYAYESTPNQSIKAGQTADDGTNAAAPAMPSPQAGTLAALARGSTQPSPGHCPDFESHVARRKR